MGFLGESLGESVGNPMATLCAGSMPPGALGLMLHGPPWVSKRRDAFSLVK